MKVKAGDWAAVVNYIQQNYINDPEKGYTLKNLARAAGIDRIPSIREFIEKIFGLSDGFKTREDLLEEEFTKFLAEKRSAILPENNNEDMESIEGIEAVKYFFKAYIGDETLREIIDGKRFGELRVYPSFSFENLKAAGIERINTVTDYIKNYISPELLDSVK